MSLQTIIKLLKWLTTKLNAEERKLQAQATAITKQLNTLEKQRIIVTKDAAIAGKMSKSVKELIEI